MTIFESLPCESGAAGMPMNSHDYSGINPRGAQFDPYIGVTVG